MSARVLAAHRRLGHAFSKDRVARIELVRGQGVREDAHVGIDVQHRSRIAKDPTQPNLRQVHLLHAELLDELGARGFTVERAQLGENITTCGVHLLGLSAGSLIRIGSTAVVRVTGLRNPCGQIEAFTPGLPGGQVSSAACAYWPPPCGVM
jgi:MOSC domain-containing protein YiiM